MVARKIYILGGIADDSDRDTLVSLLTEKTGGAVEWQWVKAPAKANWRAPPAELNRMMGALKKLQPDEVRVVLLNSTNKDTKNRLYESYPDPVKAPRDCATGDALIEWLLSTEAGLIPGLPWEAELRIAAFFCVMAKLLRNKSCSNGVHGHDWTTEANLLGQAPVSTSGCPEIRREAGGLLDRMDGTVLITKGGSQGYTKKEWAINIAVLPAVKNAFLNRSVDPLRSCAALAPLIAYLESGTSAHYRLDEVIREERVRYVCREQDRTPADAER